ncbi:MAG TPA: hypothetical protein VFQ46_01095, partial [Candidatus Limnocylindria bacterium]|nr:hypothetical protein [Candidatus Limnocylindria bacterium]
KISWISCQDVARLSVSALAPGRAPNTTIKLGGPDALRAQHAAATDSLQQSFAGLMLYYAGGEVIDTAEALRMLPVGQLTSVRDYFRGATTAAP